MTHGEFTSLGEPKTPREFAENRVWVHRFVPSPGGKAHLYVLVCGYPDTKNVVLSLPILATDNDADDERRAEETRRTWVDLIAGWVQVGGDMK